ncbi:MAG: WXG100 family type VII secretion target [Oscillospiraceae bacterium]|nr:WXG100 family type VII secretion target [Oscillospiraceae bacterium]
MSTEYDSKKIRKLAAQIGRTADAVSDVNRTTLKSVQSEMPTNFKGSAATALQDSVSELMADIATVSAMLSDIKAALNSLATRVERADQQAKSIVRSK